MSTNYIVVYIKNGEERGYDEYKKGTTLSEVVDDINYTMNRYGVDYEYVTIFDENDYNDINYYKVQKIDGKYELEV